MVYYALDFLFNMDEAENKLLIAKRIQESKKNKEKNISLVT